MAAAALLAAGYFVLGYAAGYELDEPAAPAVSEEYVLSGPALWRTLPSEQLANVEEGIMERISELEDELERVREMQQENMAYLHE